MRFSFSLFACATFAAKNCWRNRPSARLLSDEGGATGGHSRGIERSDDPTGVEAVVLDHLSIILTEGSGTAMASKPRILVCLHSLRRGELAVGEEPGIHDADLDPAVSSACLFAVARHTRVGLAKALGGHDRRGDSSLH